MSRGVLTLAGVRSVADAAPIAPPPLLAVVEERPRFWLVWTKYGRNPRKTHESLDSARAEARRLTALTGKTFVVLEAVAKFKRPPTDETGEGA